MEKAKKRGRLKFILILIIALFGVFAGFNINRYIKDRSVAFRTEGRALQIYRNGEWSDFTVKGVNIGLSEPGHFPEEMASGLSQYTRWFKMIEELNANTIRIFTVYPPDFYQAFGEYNMFADKPIYLLQGIWLNENDIKTRLNAFDEKLIAGFRNEIKNTIDVIHGKAVLKLNKENIRGSYRFDVSPYVMGYILGQEMNADFVVNTNLLNEGMAEFKGEYLYTENASPFEIWLAGMADFAVSYEQSKYSGPQKPISWTDWAATDPLEHLNESNRNITDAVSVDYEHIFSSGKFKAGIFAAYGVYPYYPDFLQFETGYISYRDSKGKLNPYEAYLKELKKHHTMPVLISEFGVSTSRGISHDNTILGYNQGGHTEKEQGEALADMFDSIINAGCAGGIVFTWQDEWYKGTWNINNMVLPERRPYWSNALSPEQNFGLLSFEPGRIDTICQVDGNIREWEKNMPIFEADGLRLHASSDERFVYLLLVDEKADVERQKYFIAVSTVNLGSKTYTEGQVSFSRPADMIVVLNGKQDSTVLVEASQDTFYRYYGIEHDIVPRDRRFETRNSGLFNPYRLFLREALHLPETNEYIPPEYVDAGKLRHGNSNPLSPAFDNLADFFINPGERLIEIRIPWMLFNAVDPSTHMFAGDLYKREKFSINPVKIRYMYFEPHRAGDKITKQPGIYSWKEWRDSPGFHERLKKSYYILKKKFAEYRDG